MRIRKTGSVVAAICLAFSLVLQLFTAGGGIALASGDGNGAAAAAADSPNLVLNPDFEAGKEHWVFSPEDQAGVATNNPYKGTTHSWIDKGGGSISQTVTIPASGTYRLSAHVMNVSQGGSLSIEGYTTTFSNFGQYSLVELTDLHFKAGQEVTILFQSGPNGWLNIDEVSLIATELNQLAEVQLNGKAAEGYNPFLLENIIGVPADTAEPPVIQALLEAWAEDAGAELSYEQAQAVPGEAKIHVTLNGEVTTHTIKFAYKNSDSKLESVELSATVRELPLDGPTQLIATGTLEDGSTIDLLNDPFTKVQFNAPKERFIIGENGQARAGTYDVGDVKVEMKAERDGRTFSDTMTITIKPEAAYPYFRDYTKTLTMKLYLGQNGAVMLNLEEALEAIKKMDNMTRGIPKIVYLVGWQHDGHDSKYPDWNTVNPRLKREQDATALDSLKWLMDEAVKYNTTVSLHINMTDAYEDSPQWDEFMEKDLIRREANGDLMKGGLWVSGQSYRINLTRSWEAGVLQRNIDNLLEMLPQLKRGGTIHIDAFVTHTVPGEPNPDAYSDPYHKTTYRQDTETQKKIMRYWHDKGLDFTSEYFLLYRGDPLYGLQPMAWWADWRSMDAQMKLPAKVAVGGRGGNELLGVSMHGEDIVMKDKKDLTGFLAEFSTTTLVWQYLNQFDRIAYDSAANAVTFSDNVRSAKVGDKLTVTQGEVIIADGTDVFVPEMWREDGAREIMAFSKQGYTDRSWKLPADWSDVTAVQLYQVGMGLPRLVNKDLAVVDGQVTLSLEAGGAVYIVPAGSDPVLDPIQELAASIDKVTAPEKNAFKLKLPEVPEGYSIRILSSSRPDVIDLKGRILPPAADTEVALVFELKRLADGVTSNTAAIKVMVPEGTIKNLKQVYSPADAVLTGLSKLVSEAAFMTGSKVGFVGGLGDNNNTATFQNVEVPGDGLYDLQLEYATAQPRSVFVSINDEPGIELPLTGTSWQQIQFETIQVELKKGMNSIKLYNPSGYAPDMGAITVSSISPQTIADAIAEIPAPAKQDKQLTLPTVPAGFTVAVKSSSDEAIIKPDGSIAAPKADTTVRVILEVTRNYDGARAETEALAVLVPGVPDEPGAVEITGLAPVDVETVVSKAPVLPAKVKATYADETTADVAVKWDAVAPSQYAQAGTFKVNGTVDGTTIKAVATVTVKAVDEPGGPGAVEITGLAPVDVETVVGKAPVLPAKVKATYADKTTADVAVKWDAVAPSQYAQAGTFKVNGTVDGTAIKAVAAVTVKAVDQPGNGNGENPGPGSGNGNENGNGSNPGTTEPPVVKPEPEVKPEQSIIELAFKPTPEQLQTPGVVTVLKVNKDGTKTPVIFSHYDPAAGIVKVKGSKEDVYEVVYTPKKFSDLTKHAWAEEAIETLAASGVVKGVSKDQFAPQQVIKRADLVVLLVRMFNLTAEADSNFADVSPTAYYYKELAVAKKLGLVKGVSETEFKPEAEVTREQMMVMIERVLRQMKLAAAPGNATGLDGFTDAGQVAGYAKNSAAALVEAGLITGSGSKLLPQKATTRAEAAAMLSRIIALTLTQTN
ncbi:S-layer homology domain-containing protein [Paenibacillus sp. GCM10027626]|uniref:S-layer homology domain-containing protein n=1 Tax=Paenibacillus sp. GCM10027626 TaxID=3273411 RepID=UPI00364057EB